MKKNDPDLMIRVGNPEMMKLVAKSRRAGTVRKMRKLLNVENVR